MNQATKRNLLKFLNEEAEKVRQAIRAEEDKKYKDENNKLDKAIISIQKELTQTLAEVAKKHGLTLKSNREAFSVSHYSFREFENLERRAYTEAVKNRLNKVDSTFSKVEREVLLGSDKEAKDVLADFVAELKTI